jgi:hypothetical protein
MPFYFISLALSVKQISTFIKNKYLSALLVPLLLILSVNSFVSFSKNYYRPNRVPDLDQALSTVRDNYKEGELIITNSVRSYYIRGVKTEDVVQMTWRQGYSFKGFKEKICEYNSGWLYWETDKIARHIRPEIYDFAERNFTKVHGADVDETQVDVYYFEKELLGCQ